jgi:hypothetical protein
MDRTATVLVQAATLLAAGIVSCSSSSGAPEGGRTGRNQQLERGFGIERWIGRQLRRERPGKRWRHCFLRHERYDYESVVLWHRHSGNLRL